MATDETDTKHGKLLVLSRAGTKTSHGSKRALWLCRCECGREEIIPGTYLRRGFRDCCLTCSQRKGQQVPTPAPSPGPSLAFPQTPDCEGGQQPTTPAKPKRKRKDAVNDTYEPRKWRYCVPCLGSAFKLPYTPDGDREFVEILTAQNRIPGAEIKHVREEALKRPSVYEDVERALLRLLSGV